MSKRQKRFIFHAKSLSRLSFQGRNEYQNEFLIFFHYVMVMFFMNVGISAGFNNVFQIINCTLVIPKRNHFI